MAATRSCGNIQCSSQHYQPGKITSQVSVLFYEYFRGRSWFVLLSKWQSHISFLWRPKQGKTRLRGVFMQSNNLCIFPRGLWCAKISVISPRSCCLEACFLMVIVKVLKFFGLNSLLWSIQFENICQSFLEKLSLTKFLITIACDSLTLIFFNITPAIKETATYFPAW